MIKENKLQLKYFFENSKKNILISKERKELLLHIANTITYELNERKELNINFICTHNSRRSHLSQVWAQSLAYYLGIKNIYCYSDFKGSNKTIFGFSKKYDDPENKHPYISITTCKNAKENCPFIPDAIERFHLPFKDPKTYDNTNLQEEKYLETNQQIAGEIFIIFKEVSLLKKAQNQNIKL